MQYLFFIQFTGSFKEYLLKIKKRFRTIFIPYFFWSISYFLIFFLLQSIPKLKVFFSNKNFVDFTFPEIISTIFINPIPYQLWFLRDLMILVLFSPVIYYLIKKLKFFTLLSFLMIWFVDFDLLFCSSESLLFFSLGSFFSISKSDLLTIKSFKRVPLSVIIWILIIFTRTVLLYYAFNGILIILFLHKISILFGLYAIWTLYDIFKVNDSFIHKNIFEVFNYSFFLYVFHEPMLTFIKKILFYIMIKTEFWSLVIYVLAPFLTIVISLIVGSFLNKNSPRLYSLVTGGR
ncbi:acyltransferase [Flavobacterium sp. 7E]|uniref:acyltransferase family protein n=1 Tax=Flavobacterium sp. 7E TaxID=2735898 RepID=UPI00352FCCE3